MADPASVDQMEQAANDDAQDEKLSSGGVHVTIAEEEEREDEGDVEPYPRRQGKRSRKDNNDSTEDLLTLQPTARKSTRNGCNKTKGILKHSSTGKGSTDDSSRIPNESRPPKRIKVTTDWDSSGASADDITDDSSSGSGVGGFASSLQQFSLSVLGSIFNVILPPSSFFNRGANNALQVTSPTQDSSEQQQQQQRQAIASINLRLNQYLLLGSVPPLEPHQLERPPALPMQTKRSKKFTLVLDLDETLVHCTMETETPHDYKFCVTVEEDIYTVCAKCRPKMFDFLEHVQKRFEVVLFTASRKEYANALFNIIDPNKRLVKYRLFREHCVRVQLQHTMTHVKELNILGRDLSKVVIIDNSPSAFAYQIGNGIPIESWFDDENDNSLMELVPFLDRLVDEDVDDVRPLILEEFKVEEKVKEALM